LHNEDEINRKDVRIGDHVTVQRAGDVIPEVVEVNFSARKGSEIRFVMPDRCPVCGSEVMRPEGEVVRRCTGLACPAKLKESLFHFASRNAFDIEGLGKKLIDQLVDNNLVKNVSDIFQLTVEDLYPLERMAEKSARNLVEAIEKRKKPSLSRLIYALGIRYVGEHVARILAGRFKQIRMLMEATEEQLKDVHEIGPQVACSIVTFFNQHKNILIIEKLLQAGVQHLVEKDIHEKQKIFDGKTFVFTGSLENMTRNSAREKVRALGGKTTSSVSKKTDYVVAGKDPGSKYEKAKKFGIKIISENEFNELIDIN